MPETTELAAPHRLSDEEVGRIFKRLNEYTGRLPKKELYQFVEHREQLLPELLERMRAAIATYQQGGEVGNLPFMGFFLITEVSAQAGLPIIIEMISQPGEGPFDLIGDAVHDVLPRSLAALASDQTELLEGLFTDPKLNRFVRWSIGSTFVLLVRDGVLTNDEAVSRLRRHLLDILSALDRYVCDLDSDSDQDGFWPTIVVDTLCSLLPHDAIDDMYAAFDAGLVDESVISRSFIEKRVTGGDVRRKADFAHLEPTGIESTVDELSHWASYRETAAYSPAPQETQWERDTTCQTEQDEWSPDVETITREQPRVGRNEPCPCGSGRKFKKCCGRA